MHSQVQTLPARVRNSLVDAGADGSLHVAAAVWESLGDVWDVASLLLDILVAADVVANVTVDNLQASQEDTTVKFI